jgi:hypothetical protein
MVYIPEGAPGEPMDFEEYRKVRYGMALWMLQENAGLSYKEARVYLAEGRSESMEHLAESLDCTVEDICRFSSTAEAKMKNVKDINAVYRGYYPISMDRRSSRKGGVPFF